MTSSRKPGSTAELVARFTDTALLIATHRDETMVTLHGDEGPGVLGYIAWY